MLKEKVSDDVLIRRIKNHDAVAYSSLYERYYERVFALSIVIIKDEDWAFDVVQETFLKVWVNREKLRTDSDIWYYIQTIAKNICISRLRETQKDKILKEKLAKAIYERSVAEHDTLVEKDLFERYRRAREKLTAQQNLIFTMCRDEGLEYKEVAERLNISKNTVKNHMIASLRLIRRFLKNDIIYLILFFLKN